MHRILRGVRSATSLLRRNAPAPLAFSLAGATLTTGQMRPTTQFSFCAEKTEAPAKPPDNLWIAGKDDGADGSLACTYDTYGGVIIDPAVVPKDVAEFRRRLAAGVAKWRSAGRGGVWLELSIADAALIPVATGEFDFVFHHAEKDHVVLNIWLPTDRPNSLPGNASHTVGVGAIVIDEEKQKILLVRERSGPAARLNIWKLPTGLVDAGEEIHEAAVREVKEETGVDAEFVDLRAFRTAHLGNLAHKGKSNLFFTVKLRCKPGASDVPPSEQLSEIAEARWFTIDEFENLPFPKKDTLYRVLNDSAFTTRAALVGRQLPLGFKDETNWMYYPEPLAAL